MASVRKRKINGVLSDKYYMRWCDEHGRWRERVGFTEQALSLREAHRLEARARLIADGTITEESEARKAAKRSPLDEQVQGYREYLLAKGSKPKHVNHVGNVLLDLIETADFNAVMDISSDRIQSVLTAWRAKKSKRTVDHAKGAFSAFVEWLYETDRIADRPRGLAFVAVPRSGGGLTRERRALTDDECARLIDAANLSTKVYHRRLGKSKKVITGQIDGPTRARLYEFALETGFRAEEIRAVTPRSFDFNESNPTVYLPAAQTKGGKHTGKDIYQPLRREYAQSIRVWVNLSWFDQPLFIFPQKSAEMLAHDLKAAGIPVVDDAGRVVDFHALRTTYITNLAKRNPAPMVLKTLARHENVLTTLTFYAKVGDGDIRKILEGEKD